MALISSGIDKVQVFELPGGIGENGEVFSCPRVALIRWRSSWTDKFYQVYVNGEFAVASVSTGQREIIVRLPSFYESAVSIEVFAVAVEDLYKDFSGESGISVSHNGQVKIRILRSQELPAESSINIYFDNGAGIIDYITPLNNKPIRVWSHWYDKAGHGMSRFGFSDFGYDSSGAVGFGKGIYGEGGFGFDADTVEWVSEPLGMGLYKFAVKVFDKFGNAISSSGEFEITVLPSPKPSEALKVSLYDKNINKLVLGIS